MKRIHQLIVMVLGLSLASALQAHTILSTIRPIQLLVEDLLPPELSSQVLLKANVSPHHYALKLSDMKQLSEASLVIWVGADFETFLAKPIAALKRQNAVLTLDQVISGNSISETHLVDDGHKHAPDAHIWLSYHNSIKIAESISAELIKLFPEYSEPVLSKLQYLKRVLEADFEQTRRELAQYKTFFAVYHDGYRQFVAEMNLDQRAYITLHPEQQVSLKQMVSFKKELRDAACLLAEIGERDKAQKLGDKLELKVVTIDLLAIDSDIAAPSLAYPQYLKAISASFIECLSAKQI